MSGHRISHLPGIECARNPKRQYVFHWQLVFIKILLSNFSFVEKLGRHGVCAQEPGGNCQTESVEISCLSIEFFSLTLHIKFNLTINIDFTQCMEVNCQDKYDKLIQVIPTCICVLSIYIFCFASLSLKIKWFQWQQFIHILSNK